jgi:CHRD domain
MTRIHVLVGMLAFALFAAVPSQAAIISSTATLSGAQEVPPTGSPATGNAQVTVNTLTNILTVNETFSGLIGGVASAAHIHCCGLVGVNEPVVVPFPGFPAATSGTYNTSFDLTNTSTYVAAFVTANGGTAAGAEAALIAGLTSDFAYVNIHNAMFPGGEIRGQLRTPEPATVSLVVIGVVGLVIARRTRGWGRQFD